MVGNGPPVTPWGSRFERRLRRLDARLGVPYSRLWRDGSARTALAYAIENHLFDLRRRIDTHTWVGREQYPARLDDADHKIYMPVWHSTVRRSLTDALVHLGPDRTPGAFVDIGCGKGKALIAATELLARHASSTVEIVGVEHLGALAVIAERNYWTRFSRLPRIHVGDVAEFDLTEVATPAILMLYNPFVGTVLDGFAAAASHIDALVVYVNPVEPDAFHRHGFTTLTQVDGWHPVASYEILRSPTLTVASSSDARR